MTNQNLKTGIGAFFFLVLPVFVCRSFYMMRIPAETFDKDEQKVEHLNVRKLDDSTYIVALDGDLYRAFHSDFADTPFLSVQNLQPGSDDRKYVYFVWQLSADGTQLSLKGVSTKVVPEGTSGSAALQKLIKENLANPKLYGDTLTFTSKKR